MAKCNCKRMCLFGSKQQFTCSVLIILVQIPQQHVPSFPHAYNRPEIDIHNALAVCVSGKNILSSIPLYTVEFSSPGHLSTRLNRGHPARGTCSAEQLRAQQLYISAPIRAAKICILLASFLLSTASQEAPALASTETQAMSWT